MSARARRWIFPALLYGAFVFWYTDFGGPLSNGEIDDFVAAMSANGGSADRIAFIEQFMREDSGRQFLMVNNIDMKAAPPQVAGAEPGESADELMARYMRHMFPALLARACHPVIMGDAVYAAMDVVGIENAGQWTTGALFRYRSRRSLMEIISNPEILGPHDFKLAALDKTIAYPMETDLYLGDPRLLLGLILLAMTALIDGWIISRKLAKKP